MSPLLKGSDNLTISKNISELMQNENYPQDQAIAIAMQHAGRNKPDKTKAKSDVYKDKKTSKKK